RHKPSWPGLSPDLGLARIPAIELRMPSTSLRVGESWVPGTRPGISAPRKAGHGTISGKIRNPQRSRALLAAFHAEPRLQAAAADDRRRQGYALHDRRWP